MKNIFKQFAELVTASKQSDYNKAIIKLTSYYSAGVFIILIIFNVLVYGLFINSIHDETNERREHAPFEVEIEELEESQITELQDDLVSILLISDAIIFIIALITAYIISKRTLEPLEKAYAKQKRFVADAAHELRTPLAVMQAGSEVALNNTRTESEYRNFIKEFLEEVKRLTTLSNDLLFLASSNNENLQSFSKISLSEICKKQIHSIKPYSDIKNILIENKIEDNIFIKGKNDDIIRLLVNLLKNSIDYNKENGSVSLALKKINSNTVLSIKDTGIGIKKENIPYIFDRFYKADNSRVNNASGTGLGLAIVKEIVNEHNAIIKVSSTLGQGTIFEITFKTV